MTTPVSDQRRLDVSVITTLYNEATSVVDLLDSVMTGSVKPSEFVVADGGSHDGTIDLIEDYGVAHPEIVLLTNTGGRSGGRNAAIAAASHPWIVCIDGGCVARQDWLEQITRPLASGAAWVGGFYEPKGRTDLSTAIGLTMVYVREEAEAHFVPSARSMALHKDLWEQVGGFPEDVEFGEDTAFADALMLQGIDLTFAPDAIVDWRPPAGFVQHARTLYAWGRGDGLKGIRSDHYKKLMWGFTGTGVALAATFAVSPWLLPVSFLPVVPAVVNHSRMKYRHMDGLAKWVLIPVATINGLLSSLAGFLAGRRVRKRSERI